MKRGPVIILTANGPDVIKDAYVYGNLAVHESKARSGKWAITHTPSGRSVTQNCITKDAATNGVHDLNNKFGDVWERDDIEDANDIDEMCGIGTVRKIIEIVERAKRR